jgi:predicted transcriptional regulator
MERALLLTVSSEVSEAIFNGERRYLLRKDALPEDVHFLVLYVKKPSEGVTGYAEIVKRHCLNVDEVISNYASKLSMTPAELKRHLKGKTQAHLIQIDFANPLEPAFALKDVGFTGKAPADYCDFDLEKMIEKISTVFRCG